MLKRLLGLLLVGLAIKLMDDFLDQEKDKASGQYNLYHILGKSILPYSLVIFSFGLYLNLVEGISFFAASYLLGMAHDYHLRLPSGLIAWQEGLIVFMFSTYLTDLKNSLSALLLILLLQFIDDLIDFKKDSQYFQANLFKKLGFFNSVLIMLALTIVAIIFYPVKLIYFIIAIILLYLSFEILKIKNRDEHLC